MTLRNMLAFGRDDSGVAAVEFAIIAPAIAGIAMTSFMLWEGMARHRTMERALNVGAEYYMNGGVSDSEAVAAVTSAWSNRPDGGTVEAERVYRCGEAVHLSSSTLCPTSKPPAVYVELSASASKPGSLVYETVVGERVVRVR
jgi:Flp pilus assembly protein TadG